MGRSREGCIVLKVQDPCGLTISTTVCRTTKKGCSKTDLTRNENLIEGGKGRGLNIPIADE